jgi:hypothetical protein
MTESNFDFGVTPATDTQVAEAPRAAAPAASHRESPLDRLRKEAKREKTEYVTYDVEGRPGYRLEFTTDIESDDVKRYQKNAQGKRKRVEDSDPMISAAQPLIERNVAIYLDGEIIEGSDGERLLLGDKEWVEIFDAVDAIHACRTFLGDGQTLSMGGALYLEAGYGADLVPVDPQKA